MRRIEDLADSPLVPALLEKVHLETEPAMMTVGAPSRSVPSGIDTDGFGSTLMLNLSTREQGNTTRCCCHTCASSPRARSNGALSRTSFPCSRSISIAQRLTCAHFGLRSHEDDVRQFRELLQEKGMPVPVKQTTLAVPTESEDRIAAAG